MDLVILALVALLALVLGAAAAYLYARRQHQTTEQTYQIERTKVLEQITQVRSALEQKSTENTSLQALINQHSSDLSTTKEKAAALEATNELLKKAQGDAVANHRAKCLEFESKIETLRSEKETVSSELLGYKKSDDQRRADFDKQMHTTVKAYEQLQAEREREKQEKAAAEAARLQLLKETWSRHEIAVEEKMRLICQRQNIEYVPKEKFPLRGKPDNTVQICEELVIFDSKSPQSDDLGNFPQYVKTQAESAKKYAELDGVKKDIYLVVPTNAIHVISEKFFSFPNYRVHIITEDAIEPILINLKRLEDYEFAEQLSPEDREKIVTVIGRMAHGLKRRIQVDCFFANDFLSILNQAENLPAEILQDAQKVEKASKLNPSLEKRAKVISTKTLAEETVTLINKAAGQKIDIQSFLEPLTHLPLVSERT